MNDAVVVDIAQTRKLVEYVYRNSAKLNLYLALSQNPKRERIYSELHLIKQLLDESFDLLQKNPENFFDN